MLNPANLFRMLTEFIFILLGGFLIWLGLSNRYLYPQHFNPRSPGWLGLGTILIYWGTRAWLKTARAARTADRTTAQVGGASLVLVGFLMLSLVVLEYRRVGNVLAAAGVILAARGLLAAGLSVRTD
jgi:hypothetical protein